MSENDANFLRGKKQHLGLWSCTRGHVHVHLIGFERQYCGAISGAGFCKYPGTEVEGWVVLSPKDTKELNLD